MSASPMVPVRLGTEDAGEVLTLKETGRTPAGDYQLVHLAKTLVG
jgi:hypothetical protein